ncbi:MAG: carbohydrate ABC transporter permease [Clostridia bacterium]|nr:carbohydrate ABC transporter permease [Clostridia bacterium]
MALFKRAKNDDASVLTKRTKGEKILFAVVVLIFAIYSLVLLYPLVYLLINSFHDAYNYIDLRVNGNVSPFALPEVWHFENYVRAFSLHTVNTLGRNIYLPEMFFNSLWYCAIHVGGQVLMSCFTGYAMAKYNFKGKEIIYALVIFSMTIPVVGTTASLFKLVNDMGIHNTPMYAIITSLSGWGFNFMVMYGFFKNVSWSYAEAVFLDGGGHCAAFFKVMLPQASMSILTLCIVSFITSWNDYMTVLMYMPDYPTMASGLYEIEDIARGTGDMPYFFAGLIISVTPIIILFSCFSDIIMKNFSIGGLKG